MASIQVMTYYVIYNAVKFDNMQSENVHHIIYSFWLLYIKESVREEKYKNACVIRNIWCTNKNEKEIENQQWKGTRSSNYNTQPYSSITIQIIQSMLINYFYSLYM